MIVTLLLVESERGPLISQRVLLEDLNGDRTSQARVLCPVDYAAATLPKLFEDAVTPKSSPDHKQPMICPSGRCCNLF